MSDVAEVRDEFKDAVDGDSQSNDSVAELGIEGRHLVRVCTRQLPDFFAVLVFAPNEHQEHGQEGHDEQARDERKWVERDELLRTLDLVE